MPETSRWRPLPWLANPGNQAMSPHAEGEKQAPVTLIKQWKERERRGRGIASNESPRSGEMLTLRKMLTKTPTNRYNSLRSKNTDPGAWAYLTNR